MIERELRSRVQETIEIAGASCDRCGSDLARVHGIGVWRDFPFRGGVLEGRIYPASGNAAEIRIVEAELCDVCLSELYVWIEAGDGSGVRIMYDERARRMSEVARVVMTEGG